MGKVAKLWREHLGLADDGALRQVWTRFPIFDGHVRLRSSGVDNVARKNGRRHHELANQF